MDEGSQATHDPFSTIESPLKTQCPPSTEAQRWKKKLHNHNIPSSSFVSHLETINEHTIKNTNTNDTKCNERTSPTTIKTCKMMPHPSSPHHLNYALPGTPDDKGQSRDEADVQVSDYADTNQLDDTNPSELGHHDVLLGRGGLTNSHPGNKLYRQTVVDQQEDYLVARKRDKIIIAQRIVALIQQNGGRFLKRSADGESWIPVTNKRAQEKTSQALREGLDVRNKRIRPTKHMKQDDLSADSRGPARQRNTTAIGQVVTHSSNTLMPSLSDEPAEPLMPAFEAYQRQISKSEIRDSCEL